MAGNNISKVVIFELSGTVNLTDSMLPFLPLVSSGRGLL